MKKEDGSICQAGGMELTSYWSSPVWATVRCKSSISVITIIASS